MEPDFFYCKVRQEYLQPFVKDIAKNCSEVEWIELVVHVSSP
jgi:hypothetical protein